MPKPTDLPRTLPLAIAAGLLALVLAPTVAGGETDECSTSAGAVSTTDGPSMMRTGAADRGDREGC